MKTIESNRAVLIAVFVVAAFNGIFLSVNGLFMLVAPRMVLAYEQQEHPAPGKTSEHEDIVRGRFLELIPNERIVESVEFESEDPAFAGEMKMTWTLTAVPGGQRSPSAVRTCRKESDPRITKRASG
jgi:uncharacterized protein YndB with AHSA1/START domain